MLNEKKAGLPVSKKRELPRIVAGTDLMSALRESIERAKAEGQSPTAHATAMLAASGKGKKAAKQNLGQRALLLPIDGGAVPKQAAEKQTQKIGTRKKAG